jgi:hypothetical protein
MCLLILAFLFLIPRDTFHDVPDFMKMPTTGQVRTTQKDGNTIVTSKLDTPRFLDTDSTRNATVGRLEHSLGVSLDQESMQPIRDWTGRVIGYAIWMKEKQP